MRHKIRRIEILVKNWNCLSQLIFLSKLNFLSKLKVFVKIETFVKFKFFSKLKFLSKLIVFVKIEIFVEINSFCQNWNFLSNFARKIWTKYEIQLRKSMSGENFIKLWMAFSQLRKKNIKNFGVWKKLKS